MPAEQEQAEAPEVDLADLQDQQDLEEPAQEIEAEQQEEQQEKQAPAPEPEPEEITVTIGDEPVEEDKEAAPEWVRDLRKKNREDQKRIRELEARLAQQQAPQAAAPPSKKPELEDFDYDTSKYEASLSDWFDKKRRYEEQLSRRSAKSKRCKNLGRINCKATRRPERRSRSKTLRMPSQRWPRCSTSPSKAW
jgi:hypothetical protein